MVYCCRSCDMDCSCRGTVSVRICYSTNNITTDNTVFQRRKKKKFCIGLTICLQTGQKDCERHQMRPLIISSMYIRTCKYACFFLTYPLMSAFWQIRNFYLIEGLQCFVPAGLFCPSGTQLDYLVPLGLKTYSSHRGTFFLSYALQVRGDLVITETFNYILHNTFTQV